jgi:hypothetical protein
MQLSKRVAKALHSSVGKGQVKFSDLFKVFDVRGANQVRLFDHSL